MRQLIAALLLFLLTLGIFVILLVMGLLDKVYIYESNTNILIFESTLFGGFLIFSFWNLLKVVRR